MHGQPAVEVTEYFGGRVRRAPNRAVAEARGRLLPIDLSDLPFVARRVFTVADVPVGARRGGHAHRTGMQLLMCAQGRVEVTMRVGDDIERVVLAPDSPGLLLGPGVWAQQTYLLEGTVLLVIASEPFDPASYVD
jgi:WxcM-like protein